MDPPGANPLSEIVDYGQTVFGSEIDDIVRNLAAREEAVRRRVELLLWDHWEQWTHCQVDAVKLRTALKAIECESSA